MNRGKIKSIIIVFIILFLSFLLYWNIMTESMGLIWSDPHGWYRKVFYLLENGKISDVGLGIIYPSGHVFIVSGFVLIWPDYLMVYFFIKIASFYLLILYIIISYVILKHIFKKHYLIFFSLLLLYLSNYFISRSIMYLPSSHASIIILISLLLIVKGYPLYFNGFLTFALFLIHTLSFFFYVIIVFPYFLYIVLSNIQNRKLFFRELLRIFSMIILIFILFIPYILNYPNEFLDTLNAYDKIINDRRYIPLYNGFNINIGKDSFLILPFPFPEFLKAFLKEKELTFRIELIAKLSIGIFFIGTLGGVLLSLYLRKKKFLIFNFVIIFLLFITFLTFFIDDYYVVDYFRLRSLETYALPIVIMAMFFFEYVIKTLKKINHSILIKCKCIKLKIAKNKRIMKYIQKGFIFFLLTSTTFIMCTRRKTPDYKYLYPEEYIKIALYARNNLESGSVIFHPYLYPNDFFNILYNMRCYYYNLTKTPTINEFLQDMNNKRAQYLIMNNSQISEIFPKPKINFDRIFRALIINLTEFSLYQL